MNAHAKHKPLNQGRLALGAMAIGGVNVLKVGLQLLMLPLMARLLGPAEFGLYALALPSVGFLIILADGGLGNSLAREPDSEIAVWSTAFWAMQIAGVCLALIAVGISFPLAIFSGQPRLPPLMAVLSISFLFVGWSVLPTARLMRDARLEMAAYADLLSTVVGAALAVLMAMRGAGAWSLAVQFVMTFGVRAVVLTIASPMLPRAYLRWDLLRSHMGVGGSIMGIKFADYLGRLAENGLVQRFLGAAVLGAYSLSNQAPRFLSDSVGNPIWASMYVQGLHRPADEAVTAYYRLIRLEALLLMPSTLLLAAIAAPVVAIFLGPSWRDAAPLVAFLLPATALSTLAGVSGAMLYARGHGDIQLKLAGCMAVARVALVSTAPFIGIVAIAGGMVVLNAAYCVAGVLTPRRYVAIRPVVVVQHLLGPVLCSLIAAACCYVAVGLRAPNLWWTVICELGGAAIFVALMLAFDRRKLMDDLEQVQVLLGRRGKAAGDASVMGAAGEPSRPA